MSSLHCCKPADGGYIVEKLLARNRERVCYCGLLPVKHLENEVCPPLYLKNIDVIGITDIENYSCEGQKIRLNLLLKGVDSRNCFFRIPTFIEIEIKRNIERNHGRVQIRRDAKVYIQHMKYCYPNGFQGCLFIDVENLISEYEIVYPKKVCLPEQNDLPLYPPPINVKNERFF